MKHARRRMLTVTKRTLSMLLVFLMLISVFPAFSITVSAANRYIYYQNTNNYSVVYAYAWDTTNNNAKKLGDWPGTSMERLGTSDYYRISVDSSANMIIFNSGSESNKTGDLNIPSYSNPLYSNGLWSSDFDESRYTGSGGGGGTTTGAYDAVTTHNFGSGIFAASATYFDYMSDAEITGSYLDPIKAGTGYNGSNDNWYPFYRFNRAIKVVADMNSNWTYPLYFGNFCNVAGAYFDYDNNRVATHGGDFVNATNSYNVTRFDYAANNSNREYVDSSGNVRYTGITSDNEVVQGLVTNRLSGNSLMATSTLKSPYFDIEFLTKTYAESGQVSSSGSRIAKVFKSYFPFKEDSSFGYTTYSFDSTNAKDNVYFTWNGEVPTAVNYGSGTGYGVQDGLSHFMSNQASGYGIFPFNNASSNNKGNRSGNDNLDYGYGIRIDIDFRVTGTGTVDGTENGTPITFNFSGDDDIWVYITDDEGNSELVLDLGGNHKMASGSINFKTMQATADKVFDRSSNNSKGSQTITFNSGKKLNPRKTYHMTVFYMERGLIESNFKMNFSFYPLDNLFTTEKYVETANINSGIRDEVANVDSFSITNKVNGSAAANRSYTLDGAKATTDASGSYKIKNGQTASFNNIATTGSTLNVTESIPLDVVYKYSTSYIVTDVENNKPVKNGNTVSTGDFIFQNTKSADEMTNFNVAFYNTPQTGDITLTKNAVNSDGTSITSDLDFPFTILLDLDGAGSKYTYQPYQLEYTLSGDTSIHYTDANGKFSIKSGQSAVFSGIPVNAAYKIVETPDDELYYSDKTDDTVTGIVYQNASSNSVTFTNTMISHEPTVVQLQAQKLLDGQSNFSGTFNFTLQEIDSSGNKIGDAQTKNNVYDKTTGVNIVEFDSINITRIDNSIQLQDMYVYGNGSSGSAWMNGENNNLSAAKNKMTKTAEGVYEITFSNVSARRDYKYRFSANGNSAYTWDSTGAFNGKIDIPLIVDKDNSTVKLKIDVSRFSFTKNSGSVTVSYTVTPPTAVTDDIYLKNTANWSTPYVYYWKTQGVNNEMVNWPGVSMENMGNGVYKYDVPTNAKYIIFSNNGAAQTSDLDAKFGYIYDNSTKVWSKYTEPVDVVEYTRTTDNKADTTNVYTYKRYFEISEVDNSGSAESEDISFVYDTKKHYAVITINQYATTIETSVNYYDTFDKAIAGNTENAENKVIFRNYHKGKMTITKVDNNGKPIEDKVDFTLYKVSGDGAELSEDNIISTKTVSDNGVAVFDNLDIYKGQQYHNTSEFQWYCIVESKAKDGYVINSTKHYFMIPEVTSDNTTTDYDFELDGKKYSYVLKNGERIYNIKYTVANAPLIVPSASGSGNTQYIYIGLSVMTLSIVIAGAYVFINRHKRRKIKQNKFCD